MPQVIITSCGTSVLTNGADPETRSWLNQRTNDPESRFGPEDRFRLEQRAGAAHAALLAGDLPAARRLSAELNGLLGIYGGRLPGEARQDMHFLLHSDTYAGRIAAEVIAAWLQKHGLSASVVKMEFMTTRSGEEFRWGVSHLVKWCEEALADYRQSGYRVVFNIVGGFKALQGVLNTLGMFYADELVYIFETGTELIRIPRLPIVLDREGVVRRHLALFRRMGIGQPVPAPAAAGIPEAFIYIGAEGALLSEWGELVWERTRRELYAERLLDPPSQRIRYGPAFARSVEPNNGGDRMVAINRRIDQLAQYVEGGQSQALASLHIRTLRNPLPPATHELAAWSDGAAPRIYFHWEAGVVVLDRLDAALH